MTRRRVPLPKPDHEVDGALCWDLPRKGRYQGICLWYTPGEGWHLSLTIHVGSRPVWRHSINLGLWRAEQFLGALHLAREEERKALEKENRR